MSSVYELFQKHAENFKQLYTVLRFACRCDHVTALVMQTYEPATAFLAAKNSTIRVYDLGAIDSKIVEVYNNIAQELEVNFVMEQGKGEIEETDLLYINTPAEGNYRAMELGRYAAKVKKYIILPNTVAHALTAAPTIKLTDNVQPIGLVHGINHFLQSNDDWFIMEHDDLDPGLTVLVNRRNVANAYS